MVANETFSDGFPVVVLSSPTGLSSKDLGCAFAQLRRD
jgi:hypothetical protein